MVCFNGKKLKFEKSCKELNIDILEIDLSVQYNNYLKQTAIYTPSPQKDIPEENQLDICSETFPHIICGSGTSQILLEHIIAKTDNMTLYINSNENGSHHIPHCHVKYNSYTNYCTLSLVDYKKLTPDGDLKNAIVCKAQQILAKNIQAARKKWNEIDTPLKFKIVNNIFTTEYQ